MNKSIAVTGIGIVSAPGIGKDSFWESVSQGISAIKPVSEFDTTQFSCHNAGEITGFNPKEYITRKSIRNLDRLTRFTIAAANMAVKDSSLSVEGYNSGVVLGSIYAGWSSVAEFHRQMLEYKAKRVNPLLFPNTVPNTPAGQVSIELGIKGINNSLSTGFASGTDALGWSLNYLRYGKADVILSGGIEELSNWSMGSFDKLGLLADQSCPFDKRRKGLVLGEGSGILVLETRQKAQKRKADIYAEIIGYGFAYNSLQQAIIAALKDAQINPEQIDYINAEGNSTIQGDRTESAVLKKIFSDKTPVSSIKPVTGHSLGASGAFDAIACILAIKNQLIPPTINYQEPDPECDLDYVANTCRKKNLNIVMSISCDIMGNSACLIFKKV